MSKDKLDFGLKQDFFLANYINLSVSESMIPFIIA